MALTLAQLQAQYDALETAYYSGALVVRFADGRSVQYHIRREMKEALSRLESRIAETNGATPSRVGLAQHKRGDGPFGPGWPPPARDI
jgi:hypothetical protein